MSGRRRWRRSACAAAGTGGGVYTVGGGGVYAAGGSWVGSFPVGTGGGVYGSGTGGGVYGWLPGGPHAACSSLREGGLGGANCDRSTVWYSSGGSVAGGSSASRRQRGPRMWIAMSSSSSQACSARGVRAAGSLTSSRSIQAASCGSRSGLTLSGGGGGSLTWRSSNATGDSASNGSRPTISS